MYLVTRCPLSQIGFPLYTHFVVSHDMKIDSYHTMYICLSRVLNYTVLVLTKYRASNFVKLLYSIGLTKIAFLLFSFIAVTNNCNGNCV